MAMYAVWMPADYKGSCWSGTQRNTGEVDVGPDGLTRSPENAESMGIGWEVGRDCNQ